MYKKFEITPIVYLLELIISILILIVAKSIFLIIMVTIIICILMILTNQNVKLYINTIEKNTFLLLFISIAYIIIYGNIISLIFIIYKLLLILIVIKAFMINMDFNKINYSIYTLLSIFIKNKNKLYNISFNITLCIECLYFLNLSGNQIKKSQLFRNKNNFGIKNYIFPKLLLACDEMDNLENNLKTNYYSMSIYKINIKSILILIITILLFIVVIFKEVIL